MDSAVVLIRLLSLPMYLYNKKIPNRVGNSVGKLMKIDENTQVTSQGKYTRMAVLINLNKPLISKVDIQGRVQLIEYENSPSVCFTCDKVGHSSSSCASNQSGKDDEMTRKKEDRNILAQPDSAFGEWMLVAKRTRKNQVRKVLNSSNQGVKSGSRYDILGNTSIADNEHANLEVSQDLLPKTSNVNQSQAFSEIPW